jgi:hypothetical protein
MIAELRDVSSYETTIEVYAHRITIRWWGGPLEDLIPVLMEQAEDRVRECIVQNFTSGELVYEDENRSFTGYWEIQKS